MQISPYTRVAPRGGVHARATAVDLTDELLNVGQSKGKQLFLKKIPSKESIKFTQLKDVDPMGLGKSFTTVKGLFEMIIRQPRYDGYVVQFLEGNDIAAIARQFGKGKKHRIIGNYKDSILERLELTDEMPDIIIFGVNDMHRHHSSVKGIDKEMTARIDFFYEIRHVAREATKKKSLSIIMSGNGQEQSSMLSWFEKNIKIACSSITGDNETARKWQEDHFGKIGIKLLVENSILIDKQGQDLYLSRKIAFLPTMFDKSLTPMDLMNPKKSYIGYVWIPPPSQICNKCGYIQDNFPLINRLREGLEVKDKDNHAFFRQCPNCNEEDYYFWINNIINNIPEVSEEEKWSEITQLINKIAPALIDKVDFSRPEKKKKMEEILRTEFTEDYFALLQYGHSFRELEQKCIVLTERRHAAEKLQIMETLKGMGEKVIEIAKEVSENVNLSKSVQKRIMHYLIVENEEFYDLISSDKERWELFCMTCEDVYLKTQQEGKDIGMQHLEELTDYIPTAAEKCIEVMDRENWKPGGRKLSAILIQVQQENPDDELLSGVINNSRYFKLLKMHLEHFIVVRDTAPAIASLVTFDSGNDYKDYDDFKLYVAKNIDRYFDKIKESGKIDDVMIDSFKFSKKYVDLTGDDTLLVGTNVEIMENINEIHNINLTEVSGIIHKQNKVIMPLMRVIGLDFEIWYSEQEKAYYKEVISTAKKGKGSNTGQSDLICITKNDEIYFKSLKTSQKGAQSTYRIYDFAPEWLRALTYYLKIHNVYEDDDKIVEHVLKQVKSEYFRVRKSAKLRKFEDEGMIREWIKESTRYKEVHFEIVYYNIKHHHLTKREDIEIELDAGAYEEPPYTGTNALFTFMPSAERDKVR